jgi:hypothetical protein
MNKHDFLQVFRPYRPPQVLLQLFDFNHFMRGTGFHPGFKITLDADKTALQQFSQDKRFLQGLIAFAQANDKGATYALWTQAAQLSLDDAPVVILDQQEGFYPIANNSREFLQLFALQVAPVIAAHQVRFERGMRGAPAEQQGRYQRWLEDTLEISPVQRGDAIVAAARSAHQKSFDNWMQRYARA